MILRPAQPDDAIAVARVHVRSWQAAYRTLLPDDYLDQLRPEDRAAKYDFTHRDPVKPWTIVAQEDEAIIGLATTMPSQEANLPGYGELCALYVDPEHWNRGVGVRLISAARNRLFGLGFRHACLWILEGNTRAARFYENDGWKSDGCQRAIEVWSITVNELRYLRALEAPAASPKAS